MFLCWDICRVLGENQSSNHKTFSSHWWRSLWAVLNIVFCSSWRILPLQEWEKLVYSFTLCLWKKTMIPSKIQTRSGRVSKYYKLYCLCWWAWFCMAYADKFTLSTISTIKCQWVAYESLNLHIEFFSDPCEPFLDHKNSKTHYLLQILVDFTFEPLWFFLILLYHVCTNC